MATLLNNAAVQKAHQVQQQVHQLAVALRHGRNNSMELASLEPPYPSALMAVVPVSEKSDYEARYETRIWPLADETLLDNDNNNYYYPIYQTVPNQPKAWHWNAASYYTGLHNVTVDHPWIAPVSLNVPTDPLTLDTPHVRYFVALGDRTTVLTLAVPLVEFVAALPPDVSGLVVQLHNTCQQRFVYALHGSTVTFWGTDLRRQHDNDSNNSNNNDWDILTEYETTVNLWAPDQDPQPGNCAFQQVR